MSVDLVPSMARRCDRAYVREREKLADESKPLMGLERRWRRQIKRARDLAIEIGGTLRGSDVSEVDSSSERPAGLLGEVEAVGECRRKRGVSSLFFSRRA